MSRVHNDSYLWLFCCCGGLPIIGLIKGLVMLGPILILSIFGFTGIALILLPHDIVLTYRAFIKTSIIGINLKILCMLLLPFALVAWPILVLFLSCCFGVAFSFYSPIVKTFDHSYELFFGGISETFEEILDYIREFWNFNYHSYFSYLFDIETRLVYKTFDINIIQIVIGLLLACYGSIVGIIVLSLMWFIKLIPLIVRLYISFVKWIIYLSLFELLMFSIFSIIGFCLIPALGVLSILLYVGFAIFAGIQCAIEGYQYNFLRGLICIWDYIQYVDLTTNSFIFDKEYTCFPDCSDTFKIKKSKKTNKDDNLKKDNISKKDENSSIPEKNKLNADNEADHKQENPTQNENEQDITQELLV